MSDLLLDDNNDELDFDRVNDSSDVLDARWLQSSVQGGGYNPSIMKGSEFENEYKANVPFKLRVQAELLRTQGNKDIALEGLILYKLSYSPSGYNGKLEVVREGLFDDGIDFPANSTLDIDQSMIVTFTEFLYEQFVNDNVDRITPIFYYTD